MGITFAKAPLIELVAELRWIPQGSTLLGDAHIQGQASPPTLFIGGAKQEEFYLQLGGKLYNLGFDRSERLLPPGLLFPLYQPVLRFRSERGEKASVLYQVGYGVFSVHAIPPYHSWTEFLPFVREGIEALIRSRPQSDRAGPFSQVSLRYIDFFREDLMQGRDIRSFVSDVLGIIVRLPVAVSRVAASNEVKGLFTRAVLPIGVGDLTVSVGDGQFGGQAGILMDNTVSAARDTPPAFDAVMEVFTPAYSVLHNIFFELTRPIHHLMQPQGEPNR